MPQVKLARSLGAPLQKALGLEDKTGKKFVENATVDVSDDVAKALEDAKLLVHDEPEAEEEATPEAPGVSPVVDQTAAEAIEHIANMRSKPKLQAIIDNDTRPTVQEAARHRLAAL